MSVQPSPYLGVVRAAIVNDDKTPARPLLKLFDDWDSRLTKGLNLIGQFIGNISATATVGNRTEGIGTTLGHIDGSGVVLPPGLSAATSSTQGAVVMPLGSTGNHLGGIVTHAAADFDTAGSAAAAQTAAQAFATAAANTAQANAQAFASNAGNVSSGTLSPSIIPTPTGGTLGGVKSNSPTPHQWVTAIDSSGSPVLAQPTFTDLSGTVTMAQLPSSVPVVSFGVGAPVGSSTEGYQYFDTSGSPYHGYIYHSGAWHIFS